MKTTNYKLVLFISGILSLNLSSQTRRSWMEEGDKAFYEQKYSNAISCYLKDLNGDKTFVAAPALPYETEISKRKPKNDSSKVSSKNFSVKAGSTDDVKSPNLKKSSPKDYVLYQLGHAYRLNSDDINALTTYKKCVDKNLPDARYYYAASLMNLKKYQDALNEFEIYLSSDLHSDILAAQAQKYQAGCYMGMDSIYIAREITVKLLDTSVFNKGTASFAAAYFGTGKVMFTSARTGGVTSHSKDNSSEYLCDLYWSEFKDGVWTSPVNFGAPLNSVNHDGAACISDNALYFTRWNDNNVDESFIYKSNKQGEKYFVPQKLNQNVNVSGYKTMQPSISADGKRLFFSSNRPGGKGGFDLWMCKIGENGIIGEARNLDYPVNTPGDEVSPFLHPVSGKLYFSSNGLTGLGGLDIFKSEYDPESEAFGIPENLGAPINSSKDESYFIAERNGMSGMFSSDRGECSGGNCYKIYEFTNLPVTFDVSGVVYDKNTREPIAGALVTIKNVHNDNESYSFRTDVDGKYFTELKSGAEYFLTARKEKLLNDQATVITKNKTVTTHFDHTDFFLSTVPGEEIVIEGIEYDFGKATLRPSSVVSLNKLADLLMTNSDLTIDIEANTDSRGNDNYNMKLSHARAQSCVNYLISKGIPPARLTPKGNGENKPLIPDSQIGKLKVKSPEWEAAHQKNRRTAFRIRGEASVKITNKDN